MKTCLRLTNLFALCLLGVACGGTGGAGGGTGGGTGGGGPSDDAGPVVTDEARLAVVKALGENVLFPAFESFAAAATALDEAVAAFVADPSEAKRDAARAAFHVAMDRWQQVEVMQVGPTDTSRSHIYAWNLDNACKVDENLASEKYADAAFPTGALVSEYGLAALEYLLFFEGDAPTCTTTPAGFPAGAELATRRAAYAKVVTANLRVRAAELVTAWSREGGNFLGTLETAGSSGNLFDSAQRAMNAITNAMYYVEMELKDMKLAIPAGISTICGAPACPELVESRFSGRALRNIEQNLLAFSALYYGGAADGTEHGFDDLFRSLGQAALAERMETALEGALSATRAFEGQLADKVVSDPPAVMALYDALKALTDIIKTEFLAVLDLQRPATGAGDND